MSNQCFSSHQTVTVRQTFLNMSEEIAMLRSENQQLKNDMDYIRNTSRGDISSLYFAQKAIKCDLELRNIFMSTYKSSTVDMSQPWKANVTLDALLYAEGIRNDCKTFNKLYGMSWMEVLKIGPKETINILNAYAHSQVEKNAIDNQEFINAAHNFLRIYRESDRSARNDYTHQSTGPLRNAYNNFWRQYYKLEWKGVLRADQY